MTTPYAAFGTVLRRGDGGAGAGTKASRTVGTGNSQLIVRAKTVGPAGNSITYSVVVGGVSTPLSVTVTGNAITINAATNGSSVAVSTVNDIIAAIYASAAAAALVDADNGPGDGTGVIAAAASGALTGGALGTEVFTAINGARSITGPGFTMDTIDATSHSSPSNYRQVLPSFLSGGEVTFDLLYDPADVQHEGIVTDFEGRVLRNFQMVLTDTGNHTYAFSAYVTGAQVSAPLDDALMMSVTLSITGAVSRTP
jgi:hypothetical protein